MSLTLSCNVSPSVWFRQHAGVLTVFFFGGGSAPACENFSNLAAAAWLFVVLCDGIVAYNQLINNRRCIFVSIPFSPRYHPQDLPFKTKGGERGGKGGGERGGDETVTERRGGEPTTTIQTF